jgi:penicillin-binding protein 1A
MKRVTGGSLPAQAWHEFMLAAHEGVPVRPLPGGWKPAPADAIVQDDGPAPMPSADVGAKPVVAVRKAAPAPQPAPAPSRAAQTVDAGGFDMPAEDDAPTSSINHPVPPGAVGGPLKKRHTTILDILSGG